MITDDNSTIGCFLEVDLDYPDDLHDLHNDYPSAGKKIKLTEEMLSEYQLQIIEDNNFYLGKNKNPILILGNKKNANRVTNKIPSELKTLFKFRITIKETHRILEFKQEPFLEPYIEGNTDLGRETKKEGNKIKKQNSKLRNSAIFGKSIENPMFKVDVKIVTTRKKYLKWSLDLLLKDKNNFVMVQ